MENHAGKPRRFHLGINGCSKRELRLFLERARHEIQYSPGYLAFLLSTAAPHLHAKDFSKQLGTRKNEHTLTTSTFRIILPPMRRKKSPHKGEQKLLTGLEGVLEDLIIGSTLA